MCSARGQKSLSTVGRGWEGASVVCVAAGVEFLRFQVNRVCFLFTDRGDSRPSGSLPLARELFAPGHSSLGSERKLDSEQSCRQDLGHLTPITTPLLRLRITCPVLYSAFTTLFLIFHPREACWNFQMKQSPLAVPSDPVNTDFSASNIPEHFPYP